MTRCGFPLTVLFFGVLSVLASGCGRAEFTFFPAEGTVTKGGRPLHNVEVVFLADSDTGTVGPRATGRTDESGHYRLRTDHGDEGAVVGKHLVLILDHEAAERQALHRFRKQPSKGTAQLPPENAKRLQDELKSPSAAPRVPPRYGRINETPLHAEISHEPLVFDIVIP